MSPEEGAARRDALMWALIVALVLLGGFGGAYRLGLAQGPYGSTVAALAQCVEALEYAVPAMERTDLRLTRELTTFPIETEVDR